MFQRSSKVWCHWEMTDAATDSRQWQMLWITLELLCSPEPTRGRQWRRTRRFCRACVLWRKTTPHHHFRLIWQGPRHFRLQHRRWLVRKRLESESVATLMGWSEKDTHVALRGERGRRCVVSCCVVVCEAAGSVWTVASHSWRRWTKQTGAG